jgi:hypothetical protein
MFLPREIVFKLLEILVVKHKRARILFAHWIRFAAITFGTSFVFKKLVSTYPAMVSTRTMFARMFRIQLLLLRVETALRFTVQAVMWMHARLKYVRSIPTAATVCGIVSASKSLASCPGAVDWITKVFVPPPEETALNRMGLNAMTRHVRLRFVLRILTVVTFCGMSIVFSRLAPSQTVMALITKEFVLHPVETALNRTGLNAMTRHVRLQCAMSTHTVVTFCGMSTVFNWLAVSPTVTVLTPKEFVPPPVETASNHMDPNVMTRRVRLQFAQRIHIAVTLCGMSSAY